MWKKPADVDAHHRRIVLGRVLRERLCDEDAGIVDQRVDAAEARDGLRDDAFGGGRVGDVAGERRGRRRRSDGLIERAVATTR